MCVIGCINGITSNRSAVSICRGKIIGLRSRRPKKANCAAALTPIRFQRGSGSGKSSKRAEVLLLGIASLAAGGALLLRYGCESTLKRASLFTGARFLGCDSPPARSSRETGTAALAFWCKFTLKRASLFRGTGFLLK